jgi:glycosyltransferase involved in cell wall biosynthesis
VTPRNPDNLAAAINHALTLDDETLEWMGGQALANARNFSLEKMCDQTIAVYRELLAG